MADPTGFLKYPRQDVAHRPIEQRVKDFGEVEIPHGMDALVRQASRCMDCGIPFCHGVGCPLANRIPEFNDMIYRGRWQDACENLHSTNNFPEITGRVCPALCEAACTLNLDDNAVLIRHIEQQIADYGFQQGWIKPQPSENETGKSVAIVGSGPAGLAAAQQLARAGHDVTVFEKDDRAGGLLRYGIPDFKLDKSIVERRIEQMTAEGVQFQTSVNVGTDISMEYLLRKFDAICLAMGASQPRDLDVPGRRMENIHFAMDYLTQQNRINAGDTLSGEERIDARGKTVVVIGGGDTGSDCVGTARRQGAEKIIQLEILPKPPRTLNPQTPWPAWPNILRTSTSHEEGCLRHWSVVTKKFTSPENAVEQLHCRQVQWTQSDDGWKMKEVPKSEFTVNADMVLLAMGFVHVAHGGAIEKLKLKLDPRGNVATDDDYQTSAPEIFAIGDTISGPSLVVRAIASGRSAAESIDRRLRGSRIN